MKHTVIISSYNRPKMLRQAILSVLSNEVDKEIFVCDDGSVQEVRDVIKDYDVQWIDFGNVEEDRLFRFPIGINMALEKCTGDIIHYLPDDDLFFPDRLANAEHFLTDVKKVGYGKLLYMKKNPDGQFDVVKTRFPQEDVSPQNHHPLTGLLDHSQVFHKRECITQWKCSRDVPDAKVFFEMSHKYKFYPMNQYVSIKRIHGLNMLKTIESKGGIKE